MKTPRNQMLSPANPRIHHALSYCAIRALEIDLGMKRNTLIMNHKHACRSGEINPAGGGGWYCIPLPSNFAAERADYSAKRANFAAERIDYGSKRADCDSEKSDLNEYNALIDSCTKSVLK